MFQQDGPHPREFPDIHRLQTLVMRDESVQRVKMSKQMCGAVSKGRFCFGDL